MDRQFQNLRQLLTAYAVAPIHQLRTDVVRLYTESKHELALRNVTHKNRKKHNMEVPFCVLELLLCLTFIFGKQSFSELNFDKLYLLILHFVQDFKLLLCNLQFQCIFYELKTAFFSIQMQIRLIVPLQFFSLGFNNNGTFHYKYQLTSNLSQDILLCTAVFLLCMLFNFLLKTNTNKRLIVCFMYFQISD